MKRVGLIVAAVVGLASGYATGQGKTNPVLDKLAVEFAAAYNAHDAAKLAAFYADDGVLMVPNRPMIRGRTNIEGFYRSEFARGPARLKFTPLESAITGAHAFEMGTAVASMGVISDNGKYLILYKRVGNDWKIAYDIFNSDQSAPTTSEPGTQARRWMPGRGDVGDFSPQRSQRLAGS